MSPGLCLLTLKTCKTIPELGKREREREKSTSHEQKSQDPERVSGLRVSGVCGRLVTNKDGGQMKKSCFWD